MDNSLIVQYNRAVPRYTSYPPVPQWNNQLLHQKAWLNLLNNDLINAEDNTLSIYLHLPFCESLCTYCGCNKRITKRHELEHPYIKALKQEWDIYKESFSAKPKLKYLHLGGGTPTFFSPEHLAEVIQYITESCELAEGYSFSFEGHPNNTTFEHLETLKAIGFTRVSYGVQDFSHKVQKAIHRIQPEEHVARVVEDARVLGYTSINFDLVYGLPFQTETDINNTIQKVALFKPDRIALYSYAHVPWVSKSQRGYDETNLPTAEEKVGFYQLAKNQLLELGYEQIGMDHFALPKDELAKAKHSGTLNRNFMGYTTDNSLQMIGLGCSSISSSEHGFVQNEKHVETYQKSVACGKLPIIKGHLLSEQEVEISQIISQLICNGIFDFSQGSFFKDCFEGALEQLEEFEADGFIRLKQYKVEVTSIGMLFIRNICAAFDIHQVERQGQMFSQAV